MGRKEKRKDTGRSLCKKKPKNVLFNWQQFVPTSRAQVTVRKVTLKQGWVFGREVKVAPGMPSHTRGSGFESRLYYSSDFLHCHWRQQLVARVLGSLPPTGETQTKF